MASLHFPDLKPFATLSNRASPEALRQTLRHVYSHIRQKLWLVGGTALSGYYAEHRRSDDLDLFAQDENTFRETVLVVKALKKEGAILANERSSPFYYHADVKFMNHSYTTDVVLDENLHRVGSVHQAENGVWVADLQTLFTMKTACLVSRCSEKDLFDLDWLIKRAINFNMGDMIEMGSMMDGGLNSETLLFSLKSSTLRKEACHFLIEGSPLTVNEAYHKIIALQKSLIQSLLEYEKKLPPSGDVQVLKEALKEQKKLK